MGEKQLDLKIRIPLGLVDDWPDFHDLIDNVIRGRGNKVFKAIAHDTYIPPHMLHRMLNRNPDDIRHLPMEHLPTIIQSSGDLRPVWWLIERFILECDPNEDSDIRDLMRQIQDKLDAKAKR